MAELEKVIGNLQILRTWCDVDSQYGRGLYAGECEKAVGWLDDVLELLKDKTPKMVEDVTAIGCKKSGYCPNCKRLLNSQSHPNYCGECGRKVKWDG